MENQDWPSTLTERQYHLWEHAALLYHSYEWQAAADFFARLSKDIEDPRLRTFCLLNILMIAARLGDYDTARTYIDIAVQTGPPDSFITAFIVGVVAYELPEKSYAEHCFRLCWQGLQLHAGSKEYSDDGLDFTMTSDMVHHNIQQAKNVHSPAAIYGIPAEIIFEAPPRPILMLTIDTSPQSASTYNFSDMLSPRSEDAGSVRSSQSGNLSPIKSRPVLSCMPKPLNLAQKQIQTQAPIHEDAPNSIKQTSDKPQDLRRKTWRDRPKTPYEPRDARPIYGRTNELSNFIKTESAAEQKRSQKHMAPRDARGEYLSTKELRELSAFAEEYAPEKRRSILPQLYDIDPRVQRTALRKMRIAEQNGSQSGSSTKQYSPSLHSRWTKTSSSQTAPPRVDSGNSAGVPCHKTPPVTFSPSLKSSSSKNTHVHSPDRTVFAHELSNSASAQDNRESPTHDMRWQKRMKLQRALTLDSLEGREVTRSASKSTIATRRNVSPPLPLIVEHKKSPVSSLISTAPTEKFFKKVLGR